MAKAAKKIDVPFAVTDWPASRVAMCQLDKIIPYANNPRTHSDAQVDLLARSMMDEGVTMPILVDESGIIIAGHGRLLAAKKNRFSEYPIVVARGWPEEKKRAARIRDNQISLLSGWDVTLLRGEIEALQFADYPIPDLGFSSDDLAGFDVSFGEPALEQAEQERELSDDERQRLRKAWRALALEWHGFLEDAARTGHISTSFTKAALAGAFVRAQLHGGEIERSMTLAYTGHRMRIAGDKFSILEKLEEALTQDNVLDSLIWMAGNGRPSFDGFLKTTGLGFHAARQPLDFPAHLARDLINEFAGKDGRVLDPCHGWGGRMLGFLLSDARDYDGFDVDPLTHDGVEAMFNDLRGFCPQKKTAELVLMPFEKASLRSGHYDFALTSPPYFDTEKYGGEQSSWRVHNSFEKWVAGFYRPLIEKTHAALKTDGVFALQIGNQRYPLEAEARKIAAEIGMTVVEKRATEMTNNYNATDPDDGEIVLILRKENAKRAKLASVAEKFGEPL